MLRVRCPREINRSDILIGADDADGIIDRVPIGVALVQSLGILVQHITMPLQALCLGLPCVCVSSATGLPGGVQLGKDFGFLRLARVNLEAKLTQAYLA